MTGPPSSPAPPARRAAKGPLGRGAGVSKGFAHIGVLKILESNQVPVHLIVGTSAGSIVGSLYAYGHNAYQVQKLAISLEKRDDTDLTVPDNGFIKGEKLEEFINRSVRNTPLEGMKSPLYAIATDIQSGQGLVLGKGTGGRAGR